MNLLYSYKTPFGSNNNNKRTSIFYFSDYHGIIPAYRYLKTASDLFDKQNDGKTTLKLSGGDLVSDTSPQKRGIIYRIMKSMNLDASAIGNHELHRKYDFFEDIRQRFLSPDKDLFTDFIGCNIRTQKDKEDS